MSQSGWENDDFLSLKDDSDNSDDETTTTSTTSSSTNKSSSSSNSNSKDTRPPWDLPTYSPNLDHSVPPLVSLHAEIIAFTKLVAPTAQEVATRDSLVKKIEVLVHDCFGGKRMVEVFGSLGTGLLLPGSDIDLCVLMKEGGGDGKDAITIDNDKNDNDDENKDSRSPLRIFSDALKASWGSDLTYLEVLETARVPIVKCSHGPTNLSLDISFDLPNGPLAAKLMRKYLAQMPPVRPLTFVLKQFLASRNLNQPYQGGVGSFCLQMMIVSFLQQRYREDFNNNRPTVPNLGAMLLDFFELYGLSFNYITTGIAVEDDGFYFPKGSATKKAHFWQPSRSYSLALENPLEPNSDVGKSSFRVGLIKRSFEYAYRTLLSHVSEPCISVESILRSIIPEEGWMRERMDTCGEGESLVLLKKWGYDFKAEEKEKRMKRKMKMKVKSTANDYGSDDRYIEVIDGDEEEEEEGSRNSLGKRKSDVQQLSSKPIGKVSNATNKRRKGAADFFVQPTSPKEGKKGKEGASVASAVDVDSGSGEEGEIDEEDGGGGEDEPIVIDSDRDGDDNDGEAESFIRLPPPDADADADKVEEKVETKSKAIALKSSSSSSSSSSSPTYPSQVIAPISASKSSQSTNTTTNNSNNSNIDYIFFHCSKETRTECMSKMLFGAADACQHITKKGSVLFLFNYSSRCIEGPFKAVCDSKWNIDSTAWRGRYNYQVKIGYLNDHNVVSIDKEEFKDIFGKGQGKQEVPKVIDSVLGGRMLDLFRQKGWKGL